MKLKTVTILLLFILTSTISRSQISSNEMSRLTSEFDQLLELQKGTSLQLMLPVSQIAEEAFTITESASALPKSLQDKYPDIKSYTGFSSSGELTLTLHKDKFYGVIKRGNQIIELKEDDFSDEKRSAHHLNGPIKKSKVCTFKKQVAQKKQGSTSKSALGTTRGNQLRTYTIIVTLTGRQSQSMGFTTKEQGLAHVNSLVNTINSVYKRELAVEFQLHPDNEKVIYLDPSDDPYPDVNVNDMISIIGINNTNIFELFESSSFHTGLVIHPSNIGRGGGRPCNASRATVGSCACIGLILHELGHHLGGIHTYHLDSSNEISALQRSMVGNNSTYLHALNFEGISKTINELNDCGVVTETNNSAPEIEVNIEDKIIPKNTPFVLTANATDQDIDAKLTYTWQQMQGGNTEQTKLLFAHKTPSSEGKIRHIPSLESQLENKTDYNAILPQTNRNISVGVLVHDNQLPVGAASFKQIELEVDGSAGPFLVTHPNKFIELESGTELTIQWNVANTNNVKVNTQEVAILISYDGGNNWSALAPNTPNDGEHTVLIPEIESSECRIKIVAIDNIFYDLNDKNFSIYLSDSVANNDDDETDEVEDEKDNDTAEEDVNDSEAEEEEQNDEGNDEDQASEEETTENEEQSENDNENEEVENESQDEEDNLPVPQELEENQINNTTIAQAFTPNNDGINDFWIIDEIEKHPNNLVKVFNKKGKEVFTSISYENDWSGIDISTSELVPPGPYYFTINLTEINIKKTGWLFINY